MIKNQFALIRGAQVPFLFLILSACSSLNNIAIEQKSKPALQYTISMPELSTHYYHVELSCSGWTKDTIDFKMPKWMPGYYQIMDYASEVKNFSVKDSNGKIISVKKNEGEY